MKSAKFLLLTLVTICTFSATRAQKPEKYTVDDKLVEEAVKLLEEHANAVDLSKKEEIQRLIQQDKKDKDFLTGFRGALITKDTDTKKSLKEKSTKYISKCSKQPNRELPSLVGLVGEIPEPKLPANTKNNDNEYELFVKKIQALQKEVKDKTLQYASITKKSPEQLQKEAEHNLNNNPVIAEMGGIEKVKNMSEKERKEAAMAAAKKNPYLMGNNNPAMQAFMKKMMTDTKFKADYEKLPDNKKIEVYQQFVAAYGKSSTSEKTGKSLQDADKVRKVQEIEELLALTFARMKEMTGQVAIQQTYSAKSFDELKKKTDKKFKALYDALPVVEMGEYGRDKQTHPLDIAQTIMNYKIAQEEAAANNKIFQNYKAGLQYAISAFDQCIDTYWGKGKAPEVQMVDMVARMGDAINGQLEQIMQRTQEAKRITTLNLQAQCGYESKLFGDCKR